MIAHVGGLPVEEVIPAAAAAAGALVLARSRLAIRLRRSRRVCDDATPRPLPPR